jgi:hypothetical protein
VAGVVVAMETDPCRDPRFPDNQWNGDNLQEAADAINDQAFTDRVETIAETAAAIIDPHDHDLHRFADDGGPVHPED